MKTLCYKSDELQGGWLIDHRLNAVLFKPESYDVTFEQESPDYIVTHIVYAEVIESDE